MNDFALCSRFLQDLYAEHNRLELLLKQVAECLKAASDDAWEPENRPDVAARLGALRDHLVRHMTEEQKGGCVDEAVARRPSLFHDAVDIYRESDQLQQRLVWLRQLVQFGERGDVEKAFREFAQELRSHAVREEKLVETGLNTFPLKE